MPLLNTGRRAQAPRRSPPYVILRLEHEGDPVVIVADPTDTPKNIYARMVWRPVALVSHYVKQVQRKQPKGLTLNTGEGG